MRTRTPRFVPGGPMRWAIRALLLLFTVVYLWSQTRTGTLLGTVTDSSGAVLDEVSVTAVRVDTNQPRVVTTNASGNYSISNLQAGTYRVEFERSGFKKETRN